MSQDKENSVKCPFCAEEIKAAAKKCKHCREWLDKNEHVETEISQSSSSDITEKTKKNNTKQKMIGVLIFVVLVGVAVLGFKAAGVIYDKYIKEPLGKILEKDRKESEDKLNSTVDTSNKEDLNRANKLGVSNKEIRAKNRGEALSGKEINDKILQESQEEESQLILD